MDPEQLKGLTTVDADKKLKEIGPNEIVITKSNFLEKFVRWIISPIALMLLAAAFLSLLIDHIPDFYVILGLFFVNFGIGLWHEYKADKAIEKLQEHLTIKAKVLRDGKWQWINSKFLVPDDIVQLINGNIVPADMVALEARNVSVNEAALTGESLPKNKNKGETVFSGSFLNTGLLLAKVQATGAKTYFGKTLSMIDRTPRRSLMEKDILTISKFLSVISIIAAIILSLLFVFDKGRLLELATLDISLLIAGIPVALPTVMSLITGVGIMKLAEKNVIVRRLSSLEDLANVNLLLSDKTGTLTRNEIRVENVIPYSGYVKEDVVRLAAGAVMENDHSPIDSAIVTEAQLLGIREYKQSDFIPADSERKRSSAVVEVNGIKMAVTLGAPQVIENISHIDEQNRSIFEEDIRKAAIQGYRVVALAVNKNGTEEKNMVLAGIFLLSDTLVEDSKSAIQFMLENGIGVKMLTGDNIAISQRIFNNLGLSGNIIGKEQLTKEWDNIKTIFNSTGGFAEILPEDKYKLVQIAHDLGYSVAVTGDGVNDLPAIKTADVGIAVKNAVDALKSTADIVLGTIGISVIRDAIVEARKIFSRLYHYSLYRISESFRVIIVIAVLGIIYHEFPLTPIQIIILAFLNDVPIVTMAFDRVRTLSRPAKINVKSRFILSSLFGLAGIGNSLLFFWLMTQFVHLPWLQIQTSFFLKLTVSGHMLIYVAHTRERWYKFWPSKEVIWATILTQLGATAMAFFGIIIGSVSIRLILFVWVWSFLWMQVTELLKYLHQQYSDKGI